MEPTTPDSRGRVLFADDDEPMREGLATLLRRMGFECECSPTAEDAMARLESGGFEALLSDIRMPGNTGLELVEAVAKSRPGLPVVLLTGRPSVETAARSVRLPVAAYLTKPPDFEELARVLDQAIADYRELGVVREGRDRLREWEAELSRIEQLAQGALAGHADGAMQDYLRVSLRQTILLLANLERATQALDRRAEDRLKQVDHIAALRHTVEVLERTRQNFKSKDLADLRRQLEWLLGDKSTPRQGD